MANTLFDHGAEYHFHTTNFTENHATMRETQHDRTKPSKLELLQEDYRSRLLHEREKKANTLFEQKVRAELLPKKGSVREFFLNRRMLVSTTGESSANGVNLPPITSNTRYKGKQRDKTKLVEKQLVEKRKEKERVEAIAYLKDIEKQDSNLSELGKLRKQYRKSKAGVFPMNVAENSLSPTSSSTCDPRGVDRDIMNTSLTKVRGVKSREVYIKRGKKTSDEGNKERNTNRNDEEFESSFNENNKLRARRGVKSREVYKRSSKPSDEGDKERNAKTDTGTNANVNTNSEDLTPSFSDVSKSLVKIKKLVNRRKTEELILRSRAAKHTTKSQTPSPRRNSQSFDEMCKAEIELRETISREQRKLLALQERKKQRGNRKQYEQESRNEIDGKQSQSIETKQNDLQPRREKQKGKNIVKKSERESWEENIKQQTRLNPKKTKRNTQYETIDGIHTNSVSHEKDVNKLRKETQTTRSTELKSNKENNSSSTDAVVDLVTCSNCGRGFMKERIAKHEKACRKSSARIKKPFDAKRKRAEGTDMEKYIIMGKYTSDDSEYMDKKRDWRRTHTNFIQSIRSARQQEPGPAIPLTNPDYIECSYCQRKFKPTVAERHIPRCKDIRARPRPPRR